MNRGKAVKSRAVDPKYYETFSGAQEPARLQILSRHGANLFELPMLFYVVLLMIYVTGTTSAVLLCLYVGLLTSHSLPKGPPPNETDTL